jgi:phosphoglycolate phosphatase-like HAD superfamily hydrolase
VLVLISDLDGTLLNVQNRFYHAQVNGLARLGYNITIDQVVPNMKYAMEVENTFLNALGISLSDDELLQYFAFVEQEFYKGWNHSFVFPDVIEALQLVSSRVGALRLITSRAWIEETRQEIKAFELDQIFHEHVYTRGDLAVAEGVEQIPLYPFLDHRRRLIQLAIADIDSPDEVWVMGDSPSEMEAAHGLGYITVGVLTGFSSANDLAPFSTHIIDSVANITTLL